MTCNQVLEELKILGDDNTKRIFINHGAPSSNLGVKVEFLKTIQKKIKKDHSLSLQLYKSGIPDAQYLAGLIADENQISKEDLHQWAANASWSMISEYTVAWIAAESKYGFELALIWIDSETEKVQASGWSTLANLVAIKQDKELDIPQIKALMKRVEIKIASAENRVRFCMNTFIISVGSYVKALSEEALQAGTRIGKLTIDVGNTACKVPYSPDYIKKIAEKGRIGAKKKMARC